MAGEPSLFLVYQDFNADERHNGSLHGTQALADAAALAGGAGFTAHQGAVTIPNGWETGWIYHPTNDTWRLTDADDLPEVGQRRYAATVLYAALDGQEYAIGQRMGLPSKVAGRVRDVLAYARWAAFSIFTSGTYTGPQQIAWATAMLTGPSDAADLTALIQKAHALTDAQVPSESFAWVSPLTRRARHWLARRPTAPGGTPASET